MADNYTSTVLNRPPVKGKAAMTIPAPPNPTLCQARLLPNGMCEAAAEAIKQYQDRQIALKLDKSDPKLREWIENSWKKKDNLATEFSNHLKQRNALNCHNCNASLRGLGPQILDEREIEYYENPSRFANNESELDKHMKAFEETDASDAVRSLRQNLADS